MKIESIFRVLLATVFAILIASIGYELFRISLLEQMLRAGYETQSLTEVGAMREREELQKNLEGIEFENTTLSEALRSEQSKNELFAKQISEIQGTVGTLLKLSKTDEELLQKYSKVYFLNENYVPARLTDIPSKYVYQENKPEQIHSGVMPFLQDMLNAANGSGVEIKIISGFRSFGEQSELKSAYKVIYGSGANQFSADQGYSEHQLGTTIDFTAPEIGTAFTKFADRESYAWLIQNAHRFGFILSYPKENSYYVFEPWHWRFIGVNLATKLHNEGKYFYETDQREINEYLVTIFD